jgi:hypothetical protein
VFSFEIIYSISFSGKSDFRRLSQPEALDGGKRFFLWKRRKLGDDFFEKFIKVRVTVIVQGRNREFNYFVIC